MCIGLTQGRVFGALKSRPEVNNTTATAPRRIIAMTTWRIALKPESRNICTVHGALGGEREENQKRYRGESQGDKRRERDNPDKGSL
jgi:hypothetical protein